MIYSARLTDGTGKPVDGPVVVSVTFFDAPSAGNVLLGPLALGQHPLVDGILTLPLVLDATQQANVFPANGASPYIEITDVTHGKTYARQKFGVVPYALKVPVDGTTIHYNGAGELEAIPPVTQSYVDEHIAGADFDDTNATALGAGKILSWDGSKFELVDDQVNTSGTGIATINGLSQSVQTFDTGITATDPAPLYTEAGTTHTLQFPMAANLGTTAGLLSRAQYDAFAAKQDALTPSTAVSVATVRLNDLDASHHVTFKTSDVTTTSQTYTWPATPPGANNQVLRTQTDGTLSWVTLAPADVSAVASSEKGANGGVATLSAGGKLVQDADTIDGINGSSIVQQNASATLSGLVTGGLDVSTPNTPTMATFKTGTADHGYLQFYTDGSNQSQRTAYFGFPSAGSRLLTIYNEFATGGIGLYTAGSGGGPELYVTPAGDVGIGTAGTVGRFDVYGGDTYIREGGTATAGTTQFDSNRLFLRGSRWTGAAAAAQEGYLQFDAVTTAGGGAIKVYVEGSAPLIVFQNEIQVTQPIRAQSTALSLKGRAADGAAAVGTVLGSDTSLTTVGAKLATFQNVTTEKAYIDKDGGAYFGSNVGIGTTAPVDLLHVNAAEPNVRIQSATDDQSYLRLTEGTTFVGGLLHYDGATNRLHLGVHDTGDSIAANDTLALTITRTTGNVGIGSTNPDEKLDVAGNIKLTGALDGPGEWRYLGETELASNNTSLAHSWSGNYKWLKIMFQVNGNNLVGRSVNVRFNSVSTNTYYWHHLYASTTTGVGETGSGGLTNVGRVGYLYANGASNAGMVGEGIIRNFQTKQKVLTSKGFAVSIGDGATEQTNSTYWDETSSYITSIQLSIELGAASFLSGSSIKVWGMN